MALADFHIPLHDVPAVHITDQEGKVAPNHMIPAFRRNGYLFGVIGESGGSVGGDVDSLAPDLFECELD